LEAIEADFGHAGPVIILLAYLVLLFFETIFPLRARKLPRAGRFAVNALMTLPVFLIGGSIVRTVGLSLASWGDARPFGLLHAVLLPFSVRFVLGFLLMDLSFYYWHRINHEWPLLWRFHNVHHCDPDMDVTTSFRFHFMEVLYSTGFRAVQVLAIGVSPVTYAVYEVCFSCETVFHHSNLRLPVAVERMINKVIVTPRMHGIHHSYVKEETNSNYSTIFRWWDTMHGSLNLGIRQAEVTIGVPAYSQADDNGVLALNAMPFKRQRDYWKMPDGTHPVRPVHDNKLILG